MEQKNRRAEGKTIEKNDTISRGERGNPGCLPDFCSSLSRGLPALCLALAVSLTASGTAWASPEFAYSAEKWETLRDNVMEYQELADLIHEYNPAVINNRLEYDEYRGKSHDDLKNAYQEAADSLYSNSERMENSAVEGENGYDSAMASAAMTRVQAEQNQELADAQNEDGYVKKLEYDQAEAVLVQTAQMKMNSYWQKAAAAPALEEAVADAVTEYDGMAVKSSAGMATQAELLAAREKMESAQAEVEANQKEMDAFRRELCVMTGWSYDAKPEMGTVPIPSREEVDAIDLESDKALAFERNYRQRANEQRFKYSGVGTQYDIMEKRVENGYQQISADMEAKYKLLKQSMSDYALAEGQYQLALKNRQSAELRYSLGTISQNELLKSKGSFIKEQSARDGAALKFSQAMEDYRWALNGLARAEGE